jgi:hypothetical protein
MEKDMTNDNDDTYKDESELPPETQGALALAMIEFNGNFSKYIKEMNPELWKKAVDYAVTFTLVDGITFEYVKTITGGDVVANIEYFEQDENDEDDYDKGNDDEWKNFETDGAD